MRKRTLAIAAAAALLAATAAGAIAMRLGRDVRVAAGVEAHSICAAVFVQGVDPDAVETVIEDGALILSGSRVLPPQLETAVIHRLELPQGCFARRIPLPAGRYDSVRQVVANGCLLVSLHKSR